MCSHTSEVVAAIVAIVVEHHAVGYLRLTANGPFRRQIGGRQDADSRSRGG